MTMTALFSLLSFAFVTSSTPGPNNVMLMSSGMNFGVKRSIAHMLGVVFGFPLMITLVGLGLLQVFDQIPHSFLVLKLLSVSYLLYLAWRIANTKSIGDGEKSTKPLTFMQAALFQWVNPKAWVMALTAISVHTPDERPLYSIFIVAMAFVISGSFSSTLWTSLGQKLSIVLSDQKKLHAVNIALAVLLVASLVPMLF